MYEHIYEVIGFYFVSHARNSWSRIVDELIW